MKEYLILATDGRDAERQKDLWLAQNQAIRVLRIHAVKREPLTWLTRLGGTNVPRVSMTVEYELDKFNEPFQGSRTSLSEKKNEGNDGDSRGDQSQS